MKIVFFTFYYPPDLSAGSFRAISLARALLQKVDVDDEIVIITTHPNRYISHRVEAESLEIDGSITIHRITVPSKWHAFTVMDICCLCDCGLSKM